jgi:hypothetical protein
MIWGESGSMEFGVTGVWNRRFERGKTLLGRYFLVRTRGNGIMVAVASEVATWLYCGRSSLGV